MVPQSLRRNATQGAHSREGSSKCRRNANLATPSPTNHRGPTEMRRNATACSPPPVFMVPCTDRRNANRTAHHWGGEPILAHRNVTRRTLSPTNHRGPNISRRNAPMASPPPVYRVPYRLRRNATKGAHQREGSPARRKNAKERTPFPINHRGPTEMRRNATGHSPPPNLGHTSSAAMSG